MDESDLTARDMGTDIMWQDLTDVFTPPVKSLAEVLAQPPQAGNRGSTAPIVVIYGAAERQMWKHAKTETRREHGGILLGEAYTDTSGGHFVLVKEAVPAAATEGSATHLQFRPESWHLVWARLDATKELCIVGWYHTHPRLGVFLSGTDLKTQRLYFSLPWQIAVVIDPVADEIGYFYGTSGTRLQRICRLSETDVPQHRAEI